MPHFSKQSLDKLETCHPVLQQLFHEIISHFDCKIICGSRTKEQQMELVKKGYSKTMNSKHCRYPSHAVDAYPYPINLGNLERFYYFAGWVMMLAAIRKIPLRWGGDWDGDTEVKDQSFNDLGHFELI